MNAIAYGNYSTIHVTPEEACSYASFETNQKLASYTSLISNVVRSFRPKRFVMTLMADEAGLVEMESQGNPLTASSAMSQIVVPSDKKISTHESRRHSVCSNKGDIYKRTTLASIKVEDDCVCIMGNWTLHEDANEDHVLDVRKSIRARGMSFA